MELERDLAVPSDDCDLGHVVRLRRPARSGSRRQARSRLSQAAASAKSESDVPSRHLGDRTVGARVGAEEAHVGAGTPQTHQRLADPGVGDVALGSRSRSSTCRAPSPVGRDSIRVRSTPARRELLQQLEQRTRVVVVDERHQRGLVGPGRRRRRARAARRARTASPRPRGRRSPSPASRAGRSGPRSAPRSPRRTASPAPRRAPPRAPSTTRAPPRRRAGGSPASAGTAPRHADGSRPVWMSLGRRPGLGQQRELHLDVHLPGDHQRVAAGQLVERDRHRRPRPSSRSGRPRRRPRPPRPRRARRSPSARQQLRLGRRGQRAQRRLGERPLGSEVGVAGRWHSRHGYHP